MQQQKQVDVGKKQLHLVYTIYAVISLLFLFKAEVHLGLIFG